MKRISVSFNEECYRRPRSKAAEAGTSVADLARSCPAELVQSQTTETHFDRRQTLQDETLAVTRPRDGSQHAADNLPRDELHECHALHRSEVTA